MKRNIVFVHLESLNMLNYQMNQSFFSTLKEIEKKSVTFPHYYSTATSTLMVMNDLAYQGTYVNEKLRTMNWKRDDHIEKLSFLDSLVDKGYNVSIIDYPSNGADAQSMNDNSFVGKKCRLKEYDDIDEYHNSIIKTINKDNPFTLWACNFISHIEFNSNAASGESGINRWEIGYERMDAEVCYLFNLLKEKGLLERTSIIFYGDHGDDIYSHGYHMGLTHAVEPYDQLIHTPMFIYDERFEPGVVSALVSTSDLGDIAKELLDMPDGLYSTEQFPVPSREYIFSRNMFAAQRVREQSFGKGYGVSDGRYLLLGTSRGLSMYETQMDPMCQNNLLYFFDINENIIIKKKVLIDNLRHHFKYLFDEKSFEVIEEKFYVLRSVLQKEVIKIYKQGNCLERLYEMEFEKINQRQVPNYYQEEITHKGFEIFRKYYYGKKVILYGAGKYGTFCYNQIKDECEVVAWVDEDYGSKKELLNCELESPGVIRNKKFDIIYIAIENGRIMQSVYEMLIGWGIDSRKII